MVKSMKKPGGGAAGSGRLLTNGLRATAAERLYDIRAQVEALEEELFVPVPDDLEPPEIVVPSPEVDEDLQGKPLISSGWSWMEMTAALRAGKACDGGEA